MTMEEKVEIVTISAPKFGCLSIKIKGTSPFKQLRFSEKSFNLIKETHERGSSAKRKERKPRDFEAEYEAAKHVFEDGKTIGIPCSAFRNAMISACRAANFQMTKAKLSIFVEPDGFDKFDGSPLVKISGKPEKVIDHVRNQSGVVDLRARAMWREWSAIVRITFDRDQFSPSDIVNLMARVGIQVGVGEGRPDSKDSNGTGNGRFQIMEAD